jgi:hypothetical protein
MKVSALMLVVAVLALAVPRAGAMAVLPGEPVAGDCPSHAAAGSPGMEDTGSAHQATGSGSECSLACAVTCALAASAAATPLPATTVVAWPEVFQWPSAALSPPTRAAGAPLRPPRQSRA